jgi:cytidyltransferase-like protein
MKPKSNKKIVITSGYWNPLHIGHINLIREAKKLGDFLVVIVNSDEQVKIKGSIPFMPQRERMEIIRALKYANDVVLSIDKDESVIESLKMIVKKYPGKFFFAKGGDRNIDNIPEKDICGRLGIKIINNVGGGKVQGSSWLLKNVSKIKKKIA